MRCTIKRTLKEKYQTEYNPKRLVTSIQTLSGPGFLIAEAKVDWFGFWRSPILRVWKKELPLMGGRKLEIQHWIWVLLAIFLRILPWWTTMFHQHSGNICVFVQPPNKQIQVTFMNFIGKMSFLCPKNPWDVGFVVSSPHLFWESLFGVSWQEGLVVP